MFRHVPNLLTGGRLLLAAVFFCLLAYYQHEGRGDPWLLNVALVVYVIALATDFLDGFLARRWHVEGQFGRLVDPFVDKILVLGAFIFFAGKNFIIPATATHAPGDNSMVVKTLTGVAPGIVVILLARELLVTTFRGMGESSGRNFGAAFIGKLKMGFQSATILVILAYVNYYHRFHHTPAEWWLTAFRDFAIWATVAITVYSGLVYLRKAMAMLRDQPAAPAPAQDPPKGAAA